MNKRILELAVQSGLAVDVSELTEFGFGEGDELYRYPIAIKVKKFAELIVRECADQCTTEGPFVAEVVWGKQFHKKILQHFGVSE